MYTPGNEPYSLWAGLDRQSARCGHSGRSRLVSRCDHTSAGAIVLWGFDLSWHWAPRSRRQWDDCRPYPDSGAAALKHSEAATVVMMVFGY
jgi:hypothetical protein